MTGDGAPRQRPQGRDGPSKPARTAGPRPAEQSVISSRPKVEVDVGALPPGERLEAWRDLLAPAYDVWYDGPQDSFTGTLRVVELGQRTGMLVEKAACAQRYVRNPVRRTVDLRGHIGFQLWKRGNFSAEFDGQAVNGAQGDVHVFDMDRPFVTDAGHEADVTLFVPHDTAHSILPAVRHGQRVAGSSAGAMLAATHLTSLAATHAELAAEERDASVEAFIRLLVGCLGPHTGRLVKAQMRASARSAAALYIERHLLDPHLSATQIAQACGVSRATLFRAFDIDGGVQSYIQRERMLYALHRLRAEPEERVSAIAHDCGFSDASHFTRRFRQHFGYSPSDARRPFVTVDGDGPQARRISWTDAGRLLFSESSS